MVYDYLTTRAFGDGTTNSETLAVWEKRHSTEQPRRSDGDEDHVTQAFIESKEADLPSVCRFMDDANNCPQNSLEEPTSKTIQTMGSPKT
jgi:hypothetical protein